MSSGVNENKVPISEKIVLTVQECAALTGIGQNTLELALNQPKCPFVLKVGRKRMIIKDAFIKYINKHRELCTVDMDAESDAFDFDANRIADDVYELFPDRGAYADANVYSLVGHVMLEDYDDMVDLSDQSVLMREIPGDKYVTYAPTGLSYNHSDCQHVSDLMEKHWVRPKTEKKPVGAYMVDTRPTNNLVIGSVGAKSNYIRPLIDVWSREKDKQNMIILDHKGEHLAHLMYRLKARGYDVGVLDMLQGRCNVVFNPFRAVIDSLLEGDVTKAVMFLENMTDILYPIDDDDDDSLTPWDGHIFMATAYAMLIEHLFKVKRRLIDSDNLKETSSFDTSLMATAYYEDRASFLDEDWSDITLAHCYQMISQLSSKMAGDEDALTAYIQRIIDAWTDYKTDCPDEDIIHCLGLCLNNRFNSVLAIKTDEKAFSGMLASTLLVLEPFALKSVGLAMTFGNYSATLSVVDFHSKDVAPKAIFMTMQGCLEVVSWAVKLYSIFMKQVFDSGFDRKFLFDPNPAEYRGIHYVLDQVNVFNKMHLETMISIGLGMRQSFTILVDSFEQFRNAVDLDISWNVMTVVCSGGSRYADNLADFEELMVQWKRQHNGRNPFDSVILRSSGQQLRPGDSVIFTMDDIIICRYSHALPPFWAFLNDDETRTFNSIVNLVPKREVLGCTGEILS